MGSSLAELPFRRGGTPHRVSSADPALSNADDLELAPGARAVLLEAHGAGVIRRLWVARDQAPADGGGRGELVLRGWFDGAAAPCIAAPLDDFFAVDSRPRRSPDAPLAVDSRGRSLTCLLPMPFRQAARLEIGNDGPRPRRLRYQIDYERLDSLPPDTALLHAAYRQQLPGPPGHRYLVCDATGTGRYVGCTLTVQTTTPGWWGEGDEIVTVDDQAKAALLGTGIDNYFYQSLFLAQDPTDPRSAVQPAGAISRWHRLQISDPVEFRRHLRVEFEDWGRVFDAAGRLLGNGSRRDNFTSVAYWYQTEPHAPPPSLPPLAERRWPPIDAETAGDVPGTISIRPRADRLVAREGAISSRHLDPLSFAAARAVRFSALRPGASMSLTIDLRRSGSFDLFVDLIGGPTCGICEVRLDGTLLFSDIDGHARRASPLPPVYLGRSDLAEGRHVVEFRVTGRSMYATGYDIEIARLRLHEPH